MSSALMMMLCCATDAASSGRHGDRLQRTQHTCCWNNDNYTQDPPTRKPSDSANIHPADARLYWGFSHTRIFHTSGSSMPDWDGFPTAIHIT